MILNVGSVVISGQVNIPDEIGNTLRRILRVYGRPGGAPDYEKFRFSADYQDFQDMVRTLQVFNPGELRTIPQKKAFWINVYNTIALHAIVHFHIKLTVWERPNFFLASEYNIGGYRFSLDDIEHGILRGNRRRWKFFAPPFRGKDPRKAFMLIDRDPRIHFALNFGARSNPPVHIYSPATLNRDLDDASRSFLNDSAFTFDHATGTARCTKIVKRYAADFGEDKAERLRFLANFLDDADIRTVLLEEPWTVRLRYISFDWHLNDT